MNRHRLVGPPGLWEMKRAFQVRFLREQGLQPTDRLLDLGCGTLRGGIPLIEYLEPGHYTGIDVRPEVLVEARKELEQHGLADKRPTLTTDPATLTETFAVGWAFSVLIHMTDDVLDDSLAFVASHVNGPFFANVNIGERDPAGWQGFPVMWRSLDFYRDRARIAGLSVEDIGSLGELGHNSGVPAQDVQRMLRFKAPPRPKPS